MTTELLRWVTKTGDDVGVSMVLALCRKVPLV